MGITETYQSSNSSAATMEDPDKLTPVEHWSAEITAAEKEMEKFYERGRQVTRRFLDERDNMNATSKWFNIFYANTNILESALYAQLPKPSVSRKYKDYNDDAGRVAALIIERCITEDLDDPCDNFDGVMRHCVQDRLVPGLAQAWLRLETDTEEISVPPTPGNDIESSDGDSLIKGALDDEAAPQKILDQRIVIDYIFWNDFLWSPCRVWEERRWVGRKVYMSREELIERFGEVKGRQCPLNYNPTKVGQNVQGSTPKEDILKKAVVYEIWDRTDRKVYWYSKGMPEILDEKEDFLGLKGFEPCPRPMLANISTSNTTPRPDYYMIQDQYTELDTINNRISMLITACKVIGVYDKSAIGVSRMLTEGFDNQLIPVDNWAMFAEKGGLKGQIDWLPLESVVTALRELNGAREVIKGQIYELTGIADIVRGASKASETLGAQQIKAQFASIRIKKLQDEVARFAGDLMRIKAELMVKHFDPEMLIRKSNILVTGNDEWLVEAMQILTTEEGFEWRIQVNSDTLAQADYAMEKADRIEVTTAISNFMGQMVPLLQQAPGSAPLLLQMMKWAIAGFKGAHEIEGTIDRELDKLAREAMTPQQQPDPAAAKMQMEQQKMQQEAQLEAQRMQAEQQMKQAEAQQKAQIEQQKAQVEMQKAQQELQIEQQRLMMEMAMEKQRLAMEMQAERARLEMEMAMEKQRLMMEQMMGQVKIQTAQALGQAKVDTAKAMPEKKSEAKND